MGIRCERLREEEESRLYKSFLRGTGGNPSTMLLMFDRNWVVFVCGILVVGILQLYSLKEVTCNLSDSRRCARKDFFRSSCVL